MLKSSPTCDLLPSSRVQIGPNPLPPKPPTPTSPSSSRPQRRRALANPPRTTTRAPPPPVPIASSGTIACPCTSVHDPPRRPPPHESPSCAARAIAENMQHHGWGTGAGGGGFKLTLNHGRWERRAPTGRRMRFTLSCRCSSPVPTPLLPPLAGERGVAFPHPLLAPLPQEAGRIGSRGARGQFLG